MAKNDRVSRVDSSIVGASMIVAALFWTGWHTIMGSVPSMEVLSLSPSWSISLPFSISRWWDIGTLPLYAGIMLKAFREVGTKRSLPWLVSIVLAGAFLTDALAVLFTTAALVGFYIGMIGLENPASPGRHDTMRIIEMGFASGLGSAVILGFAAGLGVALGSIFVIVGGAAMVTASRELLRGR